MNGYIVVWLLVTTFLAAEYFLMGAIPAFSILKRLYPTLTTEPGRQLSLYLGWAGILTMLCMNVYSVRKRFSFMQELGRLSSWLEFHIFCGLLGPTFILFHSNFKVRGLVAISFWSMIVSSTSGVVGRYLYGQLLKRRKEYEDEVDFWSNALKEIQSKAKVEVSDEEIEHTKIEALEFVGVGKNAIDSDGTLQVSPVRALTSSVMGDLRLAFDSPRAIPGLSRSSQMILTQFALAKRRLLYLEPLRKLMGYWHTFHTPFAFFMYVAAAIHIAAALILGVSK